MQVGGCLRETLKFGHCERREQRNCPDVVNRQHGSVESKKRGADQGADATTTPKAYKDALLALSTHTTLPAALLSMPCSLFSWKAE